MRRWGHHAVSKGITTTAVMLLVAAAATSVGAQGSDPEFDHAKEVRQSMGFEAGDAYVRESLADPERFPSDAWGVPLTNAETNELSRRSRMVLDASDTVAEAGRMDGFAGVYMDHDRDGRLVFQFSKGVQAAEQALTASMPSDVDFGVRKVDCSLEELDAVGEDLLSRADRLLDQDIQLVSLRYDIQDNRVVAAVDGAPSSAERVFEDVSGSFVVEAGEAAVLDACNDVTDCPAAKGGIRSAMASSARLRSSGSGRTAPRIESSSPRVIASKAMPTGPGRTMATWSGRTRRGSGPRVPAHPTPQSRVTSASSSSTAASGRRRATTTSSSSTTAERSAASGTSTTRSPVRRSAPSVLAARTRGGPSSGAARSRPTTRSV